MSKPSFFYEPEGTKFRPASPGTLLVFLAARFVGKLFGAFRDGIRGGRKSR
jgi:hypothetical protein